MEINVFFKKIHNKRYIHRLNYMCDFVNVFIHLTKEIVEERKEKGQKEEKNTWKD